jgi:hypothetical protein
MTAATREGKPVSPREPAVGTRRARVRVCMQLRDLAYQLAVRRVVGSLSGP